MRSPWKLCVGLVLLGAGGCAGVIAEQRLELRRQDAIDKVAFDRPTCAAKDIQILRTSKDNRSIEIDACGSVFMYQDIGDEKSSRGVWINVTESARW
ncbi:MAG TPA: hypothetical protein VGG33_14310 [Polyangia bacterium]